MKNDSGGKLNVDTISMTNVLFEDIIINFGFGTKDQKKAWLREHADKKVFMDLTCYDPAEFYGEFPQLQGSFAALFCDEEKKMEIHFKKKDPRVLSKLVQLGFTPVETTIVSCGFIFPRTIVQIINEAFFALAEGVATKDDIDRAMKFGVNYPKGPFEWATGRETYVQTLLKELLLKTNDKRYLPSSLLSE
ncbi:MAG TPA: 3-hydroxyacyl-CoA dehydrogenase family protein [Bacteriovoracaceae bacterium]|nr:3-hydroxyacyl-CoA dehydrogenase family protein [Bacteriovoracaceae bacterium]